MIRKITVIFLLLLAAAFANAQNRSPELWQQVEIIARGNSLIHILNGQVITVSVDEDPANRAPQGIMSLQLEGSGQVWYRNVYVRQLLQ